MTKISIDIEDSLIDSFCEKKSYKQSINVFGKVIVSNLTKSQFVAAFLKSYLIDEVIDLDVSKQISLIKTTTETKPIYDKTPADGVVVSVDSGDVVVP